MSVLGPDIALQDAFKAGDDVLLGAVQGIAELITRRGLINVDFADVRTVMAEKGMAMMGTGQADGPDRARVAAEAAVSSPLLEDISLTGAKGILVNATAGPNLGLGEFKEVGNTVKAFASDDATVVVGTVIDPNMESEIRVTVVATGIESENPLPAETPRLVVGSDTTVNKETRDQDLLTKLQGEESKGNKPDKDDYLDIPAFLRRQVD